MNCQASDLTDISLGKLDKNEQSLVTRGPLQGLVLLPASRKRMLKEPTWLGADCLFLLLQLEFMSSAVFFYASEMQSPTSVFSEEPTHLEKLI